MRRVALLSIALFAAACGGESASDGGTDASVRTDATPSRDATPNPDATAPMDAAPNPDAMATMDATANPDATEMMTDAESPDAFEPDATPTMDAAEPDATPAMDAMPMADAANPDATPAMDAALDAGMPDTGAQVDAGVGGLITVIVTGGENEVPQANVTVLFSNPNGTVIGTAMTNAQGQATGTVPQGGMATVFRQQATPAYFFAETRGSLVPPETIYFRDWANGGPPPPPVSRATVVLPGTAAGAGTYQAENGCDQQENTTPTLLPLEVDVECIRPNNTFPVFAQAYAGMGNSRNTVAYSMVPSTTVMGPTQTVTMPAWSTTFRSTRVTTSNPPATAAGIGWGADFVVNGETFDFYGDDTFGPLNPAMLPSWTLRTPTANVERFLPGIGLFNQAFTSFSLRTDFLQTVPATLSYDLTNDVLPFVSNAMFNATPLERPTLSWTVATGLPALADATIVEIHWRESNMSTNHEWTARISPNATSFQLPELPTALVAYRPAAGLTWDDRTVTYGDYSPVTGHDTLRRDPEPNVLPAEFFIRFANTEAR
jgi:hypothetical protein